MSAAFAKGGTAASFKTIDTVLDAAINKLVISKENDKSTSLVTGKYYGFRVAAINEEGQSDWSPVLTTLVVGKPGKPTTLANKKETTNNKIHVSWVAPTDTGGSAIIDYQILADSG